MNEKVREGTCSFDVKMEYYFSICATKYFLNAFCRNENIGVFGYRNSHHPH